MVHKKCEMQVWIKGGFGGYYKFPKKSYFMTTPTAKKRVLNQESK
jgi:hypothetical protein